MPTSNYFQKDHQENRLEKLSSSNLNLEEYPGIQGKHLDVCTGLLP